LRILLFGGSGQLGTELRRTLAPIGEVVATTRSETLGNGLSCQFADFGTPGSLPGLIERIAPDVVVNAAAYTAVDAAEDDPAAAWRANAEAPSAIAETCAARDILMVHYSTDYVFDGTATRPYREDDPTAPLGVYGASKLAGERAVQASGARHMIFRTAWVYAAHGKNFLRTMLRLAVEREELRVVADQVGCPTSVSRIADVTSTMLLNPRRVSGLWHLTAAGQVSWHAFAESIVQGAHERGLIDRIPRILPIGTSDYPTRAVRPAYSVLDNTRLEIDAGLAAQDWRIGLSQVLDRLAAERTS
jgi:dTDP-4-dehydrorhamnose reductase